ncbi:pyocin knob domain-containing protein [Enterococcus sp. CR-Ec1]|uniref:pyocin knob domain-containing protein n=1 Tax=Enterococcus sp. CR-Ec1 TaxID=2057791 RepID=UPI000C77BB8C|nr:pyocin knob domain-containing protein [Enterococcus sp. CR-Ec1]AUJ86835.1 hypothetical protein CXM95_15705 [Enterococcus sp. CR-Ec1]
MAKQWKNEDIIYPEDAQRWESGLENAQQNNAQNETNLKNHTDNKSNPHNVTAAQTGAYTKAEADTKDSTVLSTAKAYTDLHSVKKDNPHGVTAAQVGAYSKVESDSNLTAALLPKTNSRGYSNGIVTDISGADLNNLTETGTFMGSALTNAPSSSWWFITNLVHTSNYITQIAYVVSATADRPRVRKKSNGIWGEWQTLMFTSDNAVSSSKLQTPRRIAGVDFDGTKDISIPANNVGAYTKNEVDTQIATAKSSIISGNVSSATKLQNPRKINGVDFDGTSDINFTSVPKVTVIPANSDLNDYYSHGFYGCTSSQNALTLLNSPTTVAFTLLVMNTSSTSIATQILSEYGVGAGSKLYIRRRYAAGSQVWGNWYPLATADGTLQVGLYSQTASKLNAARTISLTGGITGQVSFDGTTNVAIPTTIAGNAPSATKLQTARKINGIAFDGSSDISITADPNQQSIPANTNLDNLTTPGFWTSVSDGNTGTLTNTPFGSGTFTLQVETGLNDTRIIQTAKRASNGDVAIRSKTEASDWRAWTALAKVDGTQQAGLIAEKAGALQTARTISLSGAVAGSVAFNGAGNVTIATSPGSTVVNTSGAQTINGAKEFTTRPTAGGSMLAKYEEIAMPMRSVLTGTLVWNDLKEVGLYYLNGITNKPNLCSNYGHLEIISQYNTGNVIQRYTDVNGTTIQRSFISGGTGWTSWKLVAYDSGWQSLAYVAPFTYYNSATIDLPKIRRINNQVYITGVATVTKELPTGTDAIMMLSAPMPSWARPDNTVYGVQQGTGQRSWLLTIYTSGNVGLSRYGLTTGEAVQAGHWLPYNLTWFATYDSGID